MNAPIKDARLRAAIEYAFCAHLDDVLLQMKIAANTFDQLEALFASINGALEKTEHRHSFAAKLASLGADMADDRASMIDCALEKYRDCLLSHGIDCGGAQ